MVLLREGGKCEVFGLPAGELEEVRWVTEPQVHAHSWEAAVLGAPSRQRSEA